MFTTAFAAVAPLKVIFFGKNNIAFRTVVKIFGLQFLFEHADLRYGSRRLMVQPMDLVCWVSGVFPLIRASRAFLR